jgi:hypothetical protein
VALFVVSTGGNDLKVVWIIIPGIMMKVRWDFIVTGTRINPDY